jgi:hypothetical protein
MKTVSSSLLSDIQSAVTTLATCIQITRKDGQILRMTTHDTDLTVGGNVYRHDLPFMLSAIQSTSQLQVDNCQLTLFADEVSIFLADFKNGLFEYSSVSIFQVNYTDTTRGTVTMRTGWFGQIVFSENHIVQVTVTGLLKVLDLEVGRVYQPSCDADLGDHRCRVALNQNQIRSELNPYRLGDWTYYYDPSLMNAFTVVNSSFETDGAIGSGTPITGWTKTAGAQFRILAGSGGMGSFSALDGTFNLAGATLTTAPYESGLYQDIAVATQIGGTTDIDAGKISFMLRAAFVSTVTVKNTWRLRAEVMNAGGVIIDSQDTRYDPLDAIDSWRERAVVMPLLPGARTVRIWLYNYCGGTGSTAAADAADRVLMYWWDHTAGNPYSGVIQHVTRIGAYGTDATFYLNSGSFEGGAVANANNPVIPDWTTGSGNWWQVAANPWAGALTSTVDGTFFLAGGDNSSGATSLYAISQNKGLLTLPAFGGCGLDSGRILLGKMTATLLLWVGYGNTTSKATVSVTWLDGTSTPIGSAIVIVNDALGTVGWHAVTSAPMTIPGAAIYAQVTLKARSPAGSGSARVGFDNVRFIIYDIDRAKTSDPAQSFGSAATVFNTTIGNVTVDNGVIWKAMGALVGYDVVASVSDTHKTFVGTTIVGAAGVYETAGLRFITGHNAGLKNLIRQWFPGSGTIKLYFRTPGTIQVGDRFFYTQSCQRRFIEDCLLRYENTVNFQGFPYVPGAMVIAVGGGGGPGGVTPVPPVVYQGLPSSGSHLGGTIIQVKGNANLQYITSVFCFDAGTQNNRSANFPGLVQPDPTILQFTTPAHAAGVVDLWVNVAGTTANGSFGGTYTLASYAARNAPVGTGQFTFT